MNAKKFGQIAKEIIAEAEEAPINVHKIHDRYESILPQIKKMLREGARKAVEAEAKKSTTARKAAAGTASVPLKAEKAVASARAEKVAAH